MNQFTDPPESGQPIHVVMAAGGTGGHIYPALAIADQLRALDPNLRITFSGTTRGMESELIPRNGYDFAPVKVIPFSRQEGWKRFLVPFILLSSAVKSAVKFRRERVDLVIGMGGYPSMPAVLGARFAGIPRLLHESNAIPGKANKFALSFTKNLGVVFAEVEERNRGAQHDVRVVGLPIRDLAPAATLSGRDPLRDRLGLRSSDRLIVVSGGSAGAVNLTNAALEAASNCITADDTVFLIKTGGKDFDRATEKLAALPAGAKVHLIAHIEDMTDAYESADLFVSRAGAASIAELSQNAVPSILVPYPWAADDHQRHNAEAMVAKGAAVMVADAEIDGKNLALLIDDLLSVPEALRSLSARASTDEHRHAAQNMATWALSLIKNHSNRK
ncbi:glycosyltransferase [Arthrobacter sp. MYb227]|uniref:UDP-N-acetylglucosamine--N-acetylmuramyl- (pentapeptide) pyrophosphoryl-undecaprenol N-acetylglucosamine transferase n=1 Tax=Arthrobacter sp. MYb227 TaxID=1848601 RepID=UPI0015E45E47|nr:UDP-N-acetylglucosamine--N-acetylmuramyl-(pentapeptide) pyrophosphoryl-undecaprenol N-acetylglucosamine transferase [Arthrobacter sp. MYb227]